MTADTQPIGAKPSMTTVATWIAISASTSTVTLRCTYSMTKRGMFRLCQRIDVTMPSTTVTVSSTNATIPVARERNQSVDPPVTARLTVRDPISGHPATWSDATVVAGEARRQLARVEPLGRGFAEDERRGARDVGVDAGRRR